MFVLFMDPGRYDSLTHLFRSVNEGGNNNVQDLKKKQQKNHTSVEQSILLFW